MITAPGRHPSTTQVLRWFDQPHNPPTTLEDELTAEYAYVAGRLVEMLPDSPELTIALRHLLDSQDAAKRAAIAANDPAGKPGPRPAVVSF